MDKAPDRAIFEQHRERLPGCRNQSPIWVLLQFRKIRVEGIVMEVHTSASWKIRGLAT